MVKFLPSFRSNWFRPFGVLHPGLALVVTKALCVLYIDFFNWQIVNINVWSIFQTKGSFKAAPLLFQGHSAWVWARQVGLSLAGALARLSPTRPDQTRPPTRWDETSRSLVQMSAGQELSDITKFVNCPPDQLRPTRPAEWDHQSCGLLSRSDQTTHHPWDENNCS